MGSQLIGEGGSVAPTTTVEEDKHSSGQRMVNLLWEGTQAVIALAVTGATLYASLVSIESTALNNTFFLVVGFYFGRTNHQRVGGVTIGR